MDLVSMDDLARSVLAARAEAAAATSLAEMAAALGAPPPSPNCMEAAYGTVVRWGEVAAKLADVERASQRKRRNRPTRESAEGEVVVLAASLISRHPNVLPLSQVCCGTGQALAVCTPWADGCLLDVLGHQASSRSRALGVALPIGSESCRRWFSDIVHGVDHLVSRIGVVPVDISAENILLFRTALACSAAPHEAMVAVLADFGQVAPTGGSCHTDVGKPSTRPPEVGCGADQLEADSTAAFQLGLLLFAMLTGVPAFSTTSPRDRAFTVFLTGRVQPRGMSQRAAAAAAPACNAEDGVAALADAYRVRQYIPHALVPLLGGLMHPDPSQRTSLGELVRDAWILPVRRWDVLPVALRHSHAEDAEADAHGDEGDDDALGASALGASASVSASASSSSAAATSSPASAAAGSNDSEARTALARRLPVPGFPVAPSCVMAAAFAMLRGASCDAFRDCDSPPCTPTAGRHARVPDSTGGAIGAPGSAASIEIRSAYPVEASRAMTRGQSRSSIVSTPAAAEAAAERASCSPVSFDEDASDAGGGCSMGRAGLSHPVAVSQRAAAGMAVVRMPSPRAKKRERATPK